MRMPVALVLALLIIGRASAHYNMLLPSTSSAKKDETITFTHQWGHPFEHELSDAPAIRKLFAIAPDGKRTDLAKTVEAIKVPGADGKPVRAHRFAFTPPKRGDYTFVLAAEPVYLEDMKESVEDVVKVVLHVQTQNGWEVALRDSPEIVPLTRPYGLLPGMVFQARALGMTGGQVAPKPLALVPVEFERYNEKPVKDAPPDELITFRTTADTNGTLTCALPESGWWGVTVHQPLGTTTEAGKQIPLRRRLTMWVHVNEKK